MPCSQHTPHLPNSDTAMDGDKLKTILESQIQLEELEELDLSGQELTELPESISQLTQLKELDLSGNQLSNLPQSLNSLAQLEVLDLSYNQFSVLPEVLGEVTQLRELYLSDNRLSNLPESLSQLSLLEELDLNGNQLDELPDSLGNLAQLRILNIGDNHLSKLPESFGKLIQLQELHLDDNQLDALPRSLDQLVHLEELDLRGNQITEVPEALSRLSQLEVYRDTDTYDDDDFKLYSLNNINELNEEIEKNLVGINGFLKVIYLLIFDRERLKKIGLTFTKVEMFVSNTDFEGEKLKNSSAVIINIEKFFNLLTDIYTKNLHSCFLGTAFYTILAMFLVYLYKFSLLSIVVIIFALFSLKSIFDKIQEQKQLKLWYVSSLSHVKTIRDNKKNTDSAGEPDSDLFDNLMKIEQFYLNKENQSWSVRLFDFIARLLTKKKE